MSRVATAMGLFFFMEKSHGVLGVCTITDYARYVRQDRYILGGTLATIVGFRTWFIAADELGAVLNKRLRNRPA